MTFTAIINEYFTDSISYNITSVLSSFSIVFAIAVIIAKNPIFSVLFLIGLFLTISLFLITLGLKFMAIAYLLVYVGAISILFLFILMLINIRVSELLTEGNNSVMLAIISIFILNNKINSVLPYSSYIVSVFSEYVNNINYTNYDIFFNKFYTTISDLTYTGENHKSVNTINYNWDSTLIENNHISSIGNILYSNLFIFIILISMILLLAMVGSIIITIKK